MLKRENEIFDKKSLRLLSKKNVDWEEIAKDCVAFANHKGGHILFGIEDKAEQPPENQKIDDNLIQLLQRQLPSKVVNVAITVSKMVSENGGEYISLEVFPSASTVACTTRGKYYIRVGDACKPVMPEDLNRLMSDKTSFVWEEKLVRKVEVGEVSLEKYRDFIRNISESERVSSFVKNMTTAEQLEYYFLAKDGYLTNLGVLWLGRRNDRALLHYAPEIHFIKFDKRGDKIKKIVWDDYQFNPMELLQEVINKIPEWAEAVEISDGIFRQTIPNYNLEIIRELVANALVHRVYSVRGNIYILLYPDRLEIHSPGLLPLGVTPENIINQTIHRNALLAKIFYDLKLMEKEGSGYDKVYELQLYNAKEVPEVEERENKVVVTIKKRIISNEVLKFMIKASNYFNLSQKEIIALGIIAQNNTISAIDLIKKLNTKNNSNLTYWISGLLKAELVLSKGKTKGTQYFVNPEHLKLLNFKGKVDLKRIEPHRLKELILTDLGIYSPSNIKDIHGRVGSEIDRKRISRALNSLISDGLVEAIGENKGRKYSIK